MFSAENSRWNGHSLICMPTAMHCSMRARTIFGTDPCAGGPAGRVSPAGAAGGRANGERGIGDQIRAGMGDLDAPPRRYGRDSRGSPGPDTGMPRGMAAWRDRIPDYATRAFRSPAAPAPPGPTGPRPAAVGLGPDANTAEAAPLHGATPGRGRGCGPCGKTGTDSGGAQGPPHGAWRRAAA